MKSTKLSFVNVNPSLRPAVLAAAQEAFPRVEVLDVDPAEVGLADADAVPPDLMVLADPDPALAARATQAVDTGGFPKWAVVILGPGSSDVAETVPSEEWNPRSLARIFRSVLLQHDLLCENLRLRGDLKTVARRISHDLRTPAGCIHTSSDLLDELAVGKGAALVNLAEIFRQSSGEISQLVDRTSFLLRASADPVAAAKVDMGVPVAGALRQLEPEIRQAGMVVMQPDTWPQVAGVAPWLQTIWWNLLRNALQHAGPAPRVRLSWSSELDGFKFSVTDTGPGVAPAILDGLFAPFDQLHVVRARGLGLSIVQRLVALQGGRCGYEKTPEAGTCFYFTLP